MITADEPWDDSNQVKLEKITNDLRAYRGSDPGLLSAASIIAIDDNERDEFLAQYNRLPREFRPIFKAALAQFVGEATEEHLATLAAWKADNPDGPFAQLIDDIEKQSKAPTK